MEGCIMPYELLTPEEEIKQESLPSKFVRNIARTGARAAESALGLPGTIEQALIAGGELARGGIRKGLGALGVPEEYLPYQKPMEGVLPTPESIRKKITKPLGGEYLKPQSDYEKLADEFVSDLVPLLLPIKGKVPFNRGILAAGGGIAAKKGAEHVGATPGQAELAKIGGSLLGSIAGAPRLNKIRNTMYENAAKELEKINPNLNADQVAQIESQFNNFIKSADEITKSINDTSILQDFITNKLPGSISKKLEHANPLTGILLGAYHYPKTAGAIYGVTQLERAVTMSMRYPAVRKAYTDIIKSASQQNVANFSKALTKLNKEIDTTSGPERYELLV